MQDNLRSTLVAIEAGQDLVTDPGQLATKGLVECR